MSEELVLFWGQQALLTALYVGGPLLMAALIVGTLVSVLQTVTQVQEMTLVFVPKILIVFAVFMFAGAWMLRMSVAFATEMFLSIGG